MSSLWVERVPSMSRIRDAWQASLFEGIAPFASNFGPIGIKIMGFLLNAIQLEEW